MSRIYCTVCQRPEIACICAYVNKQKNKIHIVVLQHPSEVKQSKGTATLLNLSLSSCQIIVGEHFDNNEEFFEVIKKYENKIALLYPSEKAALLEYINASSEHNSQSGTEPDTQLTRQSNIECLILLDGTWKKAYRLYMMNKSLHDISHVLLPDTIKSGYQIRKTAKQGALSTLEACCYALARLENAQNKYQKIIDSFTQFNQQQLSFSQKNNVF